MVKHICCTFAATINEAKAAGTKDAWRVATSLPTRDAGGAAGRYARRFQRADGSQIGTATDTCDRMRTGCKTVGLRGQGGGVAAAHGACQAQVQDGGGGA